MIKKAIFLDRDGTLIRDKDYLSKPEEVELFPGVEEALKELSSAGFALFIVSNQSGVGRGYFTMDDVDRVHRHLCSILESAGVRFEKIFVAPEAPGQPSHGRKPSPQFLLDARDEFGVCLGDSYMIGDKFIDLECGWNAAVKRSILVRTGYGSKEEKVHAGQMRDAVVVEDLIQASKWILGRKD